MRMALPVRVVLGVAVILGAAGLTAAAGAGEPISKEMLKERGDAWVGCLPRVPKERESVVYWYSFSNPRTECMHCDNCLVI